MFVERAPTLASSSSVHVHACSSPARVLVGKLTCVVPTNHPATCVACKATVASQLRKEGKAAGFKYMSDSWVVEVARNCPEDFPSVGPPWDPTGSVWVAHIRWRRIHDVFLCGVFCVACFCGVFLCGVWHKAVVYAT
jgi:hypothetical protein